MNKDDIIELSLGELAIGLPGSPQLLMNHKIDWFKYHTSSLEDFLGDNQEALDEVVEDLLKLNEVEYDGPNWLKESSVGLMCDYIEENFHKPERKEIIAIWKDLKENIKNLEEQNSPLLDTVKSVQKCFRFFREEFLYHMDAEEKELFSMLRQMDIYQKPQDAVPPVSFGAISKPLNFWEDEHKVICLQVAELRSYLGTEGLSAEEYALKDLFIRIDDLVCSLRQHVNFEDVILEPAAYKLEQAISL